MPKLHRRLSLAVASILSCVALSPLMATANAVENPQSSGEASNAELDAGVEAELGQFWDSYNVPSEQQKNLLEKLENGVRWDSFGKNAEPVLSEEQDSAAESVTVNRFADGSISVESISKPTGLNEGISTRSVKDCRVVSGNNGTQRQTGCHAQVNLGVISMGFYFDKITSPGALGRVTNQYGEHNHIIGGALGNHRLQKFNDQTVRYSADFDVAFRGFPVGWTAWMQVNLGQGNYAYTTNN